MVPIISVLWTTFSTSQQPGPPPPLSYNFYIDFNKAFNSVPHNTPLTVLHHYRLPSELVTLVQRLYLHPLDAPLVNNTTPIQYLQTRGVRQGCPLSPLLFILYSNILLFAAPQPSLDESPNKTSSHVFVDNKLYRPPSPAFIQRVINFYDTEARQWGLDMNNDKSAQLRHSWYMCSR